MGIFSKKKPLIKTEWTAPTINFYKFNGEIGVVEVFIKNEFGAIKNKLDNFLINGQCP